MKKFLKILVRIIVYSAILGGLGYVFWPRLQSIWPQIQGQYFPCRQPIAYSIGAFDKRFGISQADFISAVSTSAQIWEKPIGRDLFVYSPDGALKINLVYDVRQESTAKLQKLGITVKDDRASYDTVKAKYNALTAQRSQDEAVLKAKIAELEVMKSKYEASVNYWNSRGGAPKDEFANLEAQRLSLNAMVETVNQMQNGINARVDDINALTVVLNRLASSLNITVDKYNTVGGQLGSEFEEGTYTSDQNGQAIDIYQFDNRAKLIRVLAHELGHALGLEHIEDPKAIMYRLNNGINEKLTASDLAILKVRCGIK